MLASWSRVFNKIIDFATRRPVQGQADAGVDDGKHSFLLDEGLDLLAGYRAIRDDEIRKSIRELVRTLAEHGGRAD